MNLYDNKEDLKTIIINTSENLGLMEAIIEKDYYSMMFLKRLIEYDDNIIFKGGTSLSEPYLRKRLNTVKGFGVLQRMVHHFKSTSLREI